MALLLRPQLLLGEGPRGYLLRLADANGLRLSALTDLGISFHEQVLRQWRCMEGSGADCAVSMYARSIEKSIYGNEQLWNIRTSRYCPHCLSEDSHWRFSWELMFVDACEKHGCWLIDCCPACDATLTWNRRSLLRCDCGAHLSEAAPHECPKAVIALAVSIASSVLRGEQDKCIDVVDKLNAVQLHRLIRLLGAYGDINAGEKPQKVAGLDRMAASWRMTSIAAEMLVNWPFSFHHILNQMQAQRKEGRTGSMRSRFGHFYVLIQRGFNEPEFAFLREAYENFVAEHWQGAIGRRNRSLPIEIHSRLTWIPANHACAQLGLSKRRLLDLVSEGRLSANERVGPSGRRFWVVRREDIDAELARAGSEIDLRSASTLLGLTRKRMASILPWLVPHARRTGDVGCPWEIPRQRLDGLVEIAKKLRLIETLDQDKVTLLHVLRYWPWSDRAIAHLLSAIREKSIIPYATWSKVPNGITGMVFRRDVLVGWYNESQHRPLLSLSVPEVAERLEVKQEVAYALVRKNLIKADSVNLNRRIASRISMESLSCFQKNYVLGRDLAHEMGTSPRALSEKLGRLNVYAVTGPGVDDCRQLVFARKADLDVALDLIRYSRNIRRVQSGFISSSRNEKRTDAC